jgi:hypothetical protein
VVLVAASLAVGACAGGGMFGPGPRSADQASLDDYAESYTVQGATLGAALGAVLGCAAGLLVDSDSGTGSSMGNCAVGAVGGGALGAMAGAAGGQIIAANQQQYASEEGRLEALNQSAGAELEKARAARAAAERLVAGHTAELRALKEEAARDEAAVGRLETALEEAEYDRDQMMRAREGLEEQVAILDEAAAEPGASRQLVKRRDELRRELSLLDRQIDALTGEIEDAEGVV